MNNKFRGDLLEAFLQAPQYAPTRSKIPGLGILLGSALALSSCDSTKTSNETTGYSESEAPVYQTYGVHNEPSVSPCTNPDCVYERPSGEPANPIYPEYWVSDWNMYRVYQHYIDFPPPYDRHPPEGAKYEKSTGTTYYDSTWTGPGGTGAMMEHYEDRCLPIFPISNKFTCSFISLGDTAFFVTYEKDRPAGMPEFCLFSKFNHPPRRDFIRHLPYSKSDSEQIGPDGQGYSFWVDAKDGKPVQTGVKPVKNTLNYIMFGYGFDQQNGTVMPQSFYFSGFPLQPANAPIVSQNYTDFKVEKPDPAETWDLVSNLVPEDQELCELFDPPKKLDAMVKGAKRAPTWNDIGRWKSSSNE
jgi:hypothetical protein